MHPDTIFSGHWPYGHCQGIAVDTAREYMYYSFTTALVKTDMQGNLIGSCVGLLGHLGCIAFNDEDGRVYGSLEYKNDAIGRGILDHAGHADEITDAFYIARFDVNKIDRVGMDACADGVMQGVYLREVVEDYHAKVQCDGKTVDHRHGCSGIDGTTFGPMPGSSDPKKYLFVAYGIYSDLERTDNDDQVLLCYDISGWDAFAKPISQADMHTCGPEKPDRKFFVRTGNTNWGVQNLEYDPFCNGFMMAVYKGSKPDWPNKPMYIVDATVAPDGDRLTLKESASSTGWDFEYGSTGLIALGGGEYYVSYHGRSDEGHFTNVRLCRWNGVDPLQIAE